MTPIFADAFYWIALLNRREEWYGQVVAVSRALGDRLLTDVLTNDHHFEQEGFHILFQ